MIPSRRLENSLRRQGHKHIAGLDEVGKGALAGPLVAGCVILPHDISIPGIKDSKQLSAKKREELFLLITKQAIQWSVGIVEHHEIDTIGITEANNKAFRKALKKLNILPDYILIDGKELTAHPLPYQYIIKGDSSVVSIAAASIVAKVTRDHIMTRYDADFPLYDFPSHKGYGTVKHLEAINKHGPSAVHRRSFSPISNLL